MFKTLFILLFVFLCLTTESFSQQSRESMAVDATAAQWSFQLAYEGFFDYHDDIMSNGVYRPEGNQGFLQFRLVSPIPKSDSWPITLLPRLKMAIMTLSFLIQIKKH